MDKMIKLIILTLALACSTFLLGNMPEYISGNYGMFIFIIWGVGFALGYGVILAQKER